MLHLFKKGDKADPGNCKGVKLLLISAVCKTFRNILNDRMGTAMKKDGKNETHAGVIGQNIAA